MILLCILDGFGYREEPANNAVAAAYKPNYDRLLANCPNTLIDGSGLAVGLPHGQMGNSEVGHLNLGAGRVVYQDVTRIDKAIKDGDFFENQVFIDSMKQAANANKAVHLFGLLSNGKVHSSLDHLYALIELAKSLGVKKLYLHPFLDGRDTPPKSGLGFMQETLSKLNEIGLGKIATVGGRYYGMDRDRRWERVDKAFRAIVNGEGERTANPLDAILKSYEANITDEFMLPVVIDHGDEDCRLADGDVCLMFNFRADRVRQLSYMLTGHDIKGFVHLKHPEIELITMTNVDDKLTNAKIAFKPKRLKNILGEVLSKHGLKQLRTAETEKYAHVTFFFNGGVEEPFEGEERDMIASPKVATYDLQPEMSAPIVTETLVNRILTKEHDFILINFANCDMVGHTGIFEAAKKAVEAVDVGLGKIIDAVETVGGVALITADHGNAELMIDPNDGGPWTAHTTNLVPLILFDPKEQLGSTDKIELRSGGVLADVAPTILEFLKIKQPDEMSGQSLIIKEN